MARKISARLEYCKEASMWLSANVEKFVYEALFEEAFGDYAHSHNSRSYFMEDPEDDPYFDRTSLVVESFRKHVRRALECLIMPMAVDIDPGGSLVGLFDEGPVDKEVYITVFENMRNNMAEYAEGLSEGAYRILLNYFDSYVLPDIRENTRNTKPYAGWRSVRS